MPAPGAGGPIPKRSSQRRGAGAPTEQVRVSEVVRQPKLTGSHSAMGKRMWKALGESGQAIYYEPADWAAAEILILSIDAFVKRPSALLLQAIRSQMAPLLVTEGDRRRARLEIERPSGDEEPEDVSELAEFRDRLANRSA